MGGLIGYDPRDLSEMAVKRSLHAQARKQVVHSSCTADDLVPFGEMQIGLASWYRVVRILGSI